MNDLQNSIWSKKYQYEDESFEQWVDRISNGNKEIKELIIEKKFLFGGRILSGRGLYKEDRKITYSNCYVLGPPKDNLEDIFDVAKNIARTFSYGGGVGVDLSTLRPEGALVHNSAKYSSGIEPFVELYSLVSSIIGQKGRQGAMMISLDVNHPDIEKFIDLKTDLKKATNTNISVKVSDDFMNAVKNKGVYSCEFYSEANNEIIKKDLNAYDLFMTIVKNNWDYAEPGLLFWDNINNNHLLSKDANFKYGGVNPCGEEPLPSGGSCLLGSINLSEFVEKPFTKDAYFNINEFEECVRVSVIALNDVLEEGLELHPVEIQKQCVKDYRQIGLGIMGIADMLIKLNLRYGSEKSLEICENIAKIMINNAVYQSALLAKERGPYKKYNKEAITNSKFFIDNLENNVKELVINYGLRNSQLLTIAPTGSISTLLGVSGGIEPIFNISYTRKTESLYEKDVYYKVYTPIVKEYMEINNIEEDNLPDVFVTAMTLNPKERIAMQSVWQKHIDASISSTINIPKESSIYDIYDIYMTAWENNLKGVTVFREGCKRGAILLSDDLNKSTDNKEELEVNKKILKEDENQIKDGEKLFICPECKKESIIPTGGCAICLQCGYSKCGN